jgi:FixJ family two-component response regulator
MTPNSLEAEILPTVMVIEDDAAVRESLDGLFRSVGLQVKLFSSVQDFLRSDAEDSPGCLVLDVRLPGKSGLEFYEESARQGNRRPVVFISGHADVPMSVRAMKAGAVEFLTKPVRDQDLLDAVQAAIERDQIQRRDANGFALIRGNFSALTPKEKEIAALVVAGRANRQIAAELKVSEATVKFHRGHVMEKMQANSLGDLIRIFAVLNSQTIDKASTKG